MLHLVQHNDQKIVAAAAVENTDNVVLVEHSCPDRMKDEILDAYPYMVVLYSFCVCTSQKEVVLGIQQGMSGLSILQRKTRDAQ